MLAIVGVIFLLPLSSFLFVKPGAFAFGNITFSLILIICLCPLATTFDMSILKSTFPSDNIFILFITEFIIPSNFEYGSSLFPYTKSGIQDVVTFIVFLTKYALAAVVSASSSVPPYFKAFKTFAILSSDASDVNAPVFCPSGFDNFNVPGNSFGDDNVNTTLTVPLLLYVNSKSVIRPTNISCSYPFDDT